MSIERGKRGNSGAVGMGSAFKLKFLWIGSIAQRRATRWSIVAVSALGLGGMPGPALALPPAEDVPEEVLRSELILQGRSPLDNRPLGPDDYAALEAALAQFPEDAVAVHPELQSLLFQLKLLKLLKDIVPFF